MTAQTLPRTTATPESQNLAKLEAELDDPRYAGFREEIQRAITELRAKSTLGA